MPSLCLEWHSLHVTFTPLAWQGCAPGLAGSRETEPGAETSFLLPTQCSAPCLLSSHHCTLELQAWEHTSTAQARFITLNTDILYPSLPRLTALAALLGAS